MVNKGSEWRKWDFHVHTKGTNKNNQFSSSSMEEFLETFFKKAINYNIKAIGITDYFTIDKYLEVKQYVKEIDSKLGKSGKPIFSEDEKAFIKNIFLFPNVELRLLPSTSKAKLINIHCLFNPEYVQDLNNDFFNHLENQDGQKMNKQGFINYGKGLDPTLRDDRSKFKKGIDSFAIDTRSLKKLLDEKKRFKDNTIVVVSNSNRDGASGLEEHYNLFENEGGSLGGVRKTIYEISNAIFSSNSKDIKYFLGKKSEEIANYTDDIYKNEVEEVINNCGSLKPCIVGCDAHKEDELFKRFTWVKADLTFEGLKQITFEPEQRVKIQDKKPDYKEDKFIIDKVKFISPDKKFTSTPIQLNKNLNVIIGGKSSGKSILLYCIARTLLPNIGLPKIENNELKYDLRKDSSNFNFELTTKGGISQRMYRDEEENSIIPGLKYIPQNYLVRLAEPELYKEGATLNKIVRDLIKEDEESKLAYDEFISAIKHNDRKRDLIINNYFDIKQGISNLSNELKSKSSKKVLENNIQNNTQKVEELNKSVGMSDEEILKYNDLQEALSLNKEELNSLINDSRKIKQFNTEAIQILSDLIDKKKQSETSFENDQLKAFFNKNYEIVENSLNILIDFQSNFEFIQNQEGESKLKKESIFSQLFTEKREMEANIKSELVPFLKNEEVKRQIDLLNNSINEDKRFLHEIEQLTKEINSKKESLKEEKQKLFALYYENYQEYLKIIDSLKIRTIELEKDGLKITGLVKFNFPKFKNAIIEISDGRSASYNDYPILEEKRGGLFEFDINDHIKSLTELFDDIVESNQYVLKSKNDAQSAIKLLFEDYFFDYWQIEYKNDKLGAMSVGKASFVILMLIIGLSKSKAPILIDQPEDNLDNRSISTDLVQYLRNKKLERQIILVTHNPNIVVNADAENIIVANQKGQNEQDSSSIYQFDYINGALENTFEKQKTITDLLKSMGIREHVAEVVEGGKEAFKNREMKYGFI